jgi:hypothetical protein
MIFMLNFSNTNPLLAEWKAHEEDEGFDSHEF